MIEVPQAAIGLAKRFEGFHHVPRADPGRAHPYVCPAGYWTIGYGHLCDPKHPPITEAEAEAAVTELRRWVYSGGKVLPGLEARRRAEIQLILSSTLCW